MKLNLLASAILRGNWLIDARIVDGMMPMVMRFLDGQPVSWFEDEDDEEDDGTISAYLISAEGILNKVNRSTDSGTNIFEGAPKGSVVVIPIMGSIMKQDYCGSIGTDTMSSWLRDARDNENISSVLLHINSGGGSVEGTGEFASLIAEVDQAKPVVAYTDGLMASAAYWLGSSAREIIASYETVEIGSIGTAIRFMDYSKMYEERGIKEHYINAEDSIDKNQDYYKALEGKYADIKENILNPTNDVFLNAVKTNRGEKLQLTEVKGNDGVARFEPLTGKVYLAQKAIDIGLIDRIGSFNQALSIAQSHANTSKNASTTNNIDNMKFGNPFKKLTAVKGKKAEDISEATLEELNAELEENGVTAISVITSDFITEAQNNEQILANLVNQVGAAVEGEFPTLTEAITALIADRDAEYNRAEAYGSQPAAAPTKPITTKVAEGGDSLPDGNTNKYETSADRELAELNKVSKLG